MVPDSVLAYVKRRGYSFNVRGHQTAFTAVAIADEFELPDDNVAESVLLRVDGKPWLALIPAGWRVDFAGVAAELDASDVEPLGENPADVLFEGTAPGAEAGFGGLYGMPVIMDEALARNEALILRSGSLDTSIEIRTVDYIDGEQPNIASISTYVQPGIAPRIGEVAGPGIDETMTPTP